MLASRANEAKNVNAALAATSLELPGAAEQAAPKACKARVGWSDAQPLEPGLTVRQPQLLTQAFTAWRV